MNMVDEMACKMPDLAITLETELLFRYHLETLIY